jgi:rhodanese-related sulfurtransferase
MSSKIIVVDVRTPEEFSGANVAGSINIPLQELEAHLDELKQMENIVLCCASGSRSGIAALVLQKNGIACKNGGSWFMVNGMIN